MPLTTIDLIRATRDYREISKRGVWEASSLVSIQVLIRSKTDSSQDAPRCALGITASKKVGGAVQRNRAKRRLRALADEVLSVEGMDGWHYVVVATAATPSAKWSDLCLDFTRTLSKVGRRATRRFCPPRVGGNNLFASGESK